MTNLELQKLLKQYPDDVEVIVYTHIGEDGDVAKQTHLDTMGENEVHYASGSPLEWADQLEEGDKVLVISAGKDYGADRREKLLTP